MSGDVLKVKLLRPGARLPSRATSGSTGLDLHACLEGPGYMDLGPNAALVPTGIAIEAPAGFDVQIRPRSGLGREGVTLIFGTIDADYRGEILVSMHTFGTRTTHRVRHGDRIGQLVVTRAAALDVVEVENLTASERGRGGHGSTGR